VSIIAAYDGSPVRSVLALVGGQNTGKTEYFRRLLPNSIQKYYAESKLDAGKDDEMLMTQKLIVMDDEMGGKSKQDEKRFKELTSKAVFSLRAPYGRHNEDFKRLALLCGTSNDPSIINDPTGNTRILPVEVISIDHELYNSVDKDELFMELVRLYESGYDWKLTKKELSELNEVSAEFETIPFERELIGKFFLPESAGGYVSFLTSSEIKDYIETNSKQKIINMRKFGIELKTFFGPALLKWKTGIKSRCYKVIIPNGNHVPAGDPENTDFPF
jgi:predicted P-loop ATPase